MPTDRSLKAFLVDLGMILYIYRMDRHRTIEEASQIAAISSGLLHTIEQGDFLNLNVGVIFNLCNYYGIDHWIAFI